MGKKVKIGGWEIPEREVAQWYLERKYAVTYSKIFQINYSVAQRCYYAAVVFTKPFTGGAGFTQRGTVSAMTADEINSLLGVKVLVA